MESAGNVSAIMGPWEGGLTNTQAKIKAPPAKLFKVATVFKPRVLPIYNLYRLGQIEYGYIDFFSDPY